MHAFSDLSVRFKTFFVGITAILKSFVMMIGKREEAAHIFHDIFTVDSRRDFTDDHFYLFASPINDCPFT